MWDLQEVPHHAPVSYPCRSAQCLVVHKNFYQ